MNQIIFMLTSSYKWFSHIVKMYAWTCRFCIVVRNISKVLLPVCTYIKCEQLCEILLSIVYVCWTMGFTTYIQMCHWNLMYEVSVSHISTNFSCQNKLFYKNLYGFHAEGIYEWRGGDRVPNPRWTTIPNFIWVTPYVLAIAYGEFIFVDLELCPFWHLLWIINCMLYNHISGIMVSLLASSVVDRGFEPWLVKPQTIKLVFVASPLSTQQFRSNS